MIRFGLLMAYRISTVPNMPSRSKIGRDEIKWQELLSHFRTVQSRHEKSRRSGDGAVVSGFGVSGIMSTGSSATSSSTSLVRPVPRRKLTNGEVQGPPPRPGGTALSPLNPKAQVRVASGNQNGLLATALSAASGSARPMSPPLSANKQRRALGVTRK
jgi:vacuole morphology and inheritance protein 14